MDRCSDYVKRQEPFAAKKGLRRELAEDICVPRRVDTRTDYTISRVVTVADLRPRVGAYPLEALGMGGKGDREED